MKRRIVFVANIILPLLLGTLIYWYTSPDVIFVEAVRSWCGDTGKSGQGMVLGGLFRFVRYYLLDMLWAYALVFTLYFSIGNNAARLKMAFVIAVVFSAVMEVVQLSTIIPGYFDLLDILVEVVAETFAAFIIKNHYEEAKNICETK